MSLSILCVTKAEPHAVSFLFAMEQLAVQLDAQLVFAADGQEAQDKIGIDTIARVVQVRSAGYLESVLDRALEACTENYVLRLDDDERVSPAMAEWLAARMYESADVWKFPRVHFWGDVKTVLLTSHLFPDHQTRLTTRTKAGGRHHIHAPSPFGGGALAPVAIEHHKFLVRTVEEREQTAEKWHSGDMLPFSLPERAYTRVTLIGYGDGEVPWQPDWHKDVTL
jgi:hypothetical protein